MKKPEIRVKFGNHKLGDDTLIFNMGSSADCPSRKKGLCRVVHQNIKCYAAKPEECAKERTLTARKEQEKYWKTTPAVKIIKDLEKKISARRKPTKYIRYNESGDFWSQECINKLSEVAEALKQKGIVTYGNSARADLDFSNAKFLCKGSCHPMGNNGMSIVIPKDAPLPKGFFECPADCRKCNKCKQHNNINIAYRKH